MKERGINKRFRIENPVWCDRCRVRIAPYEEIERADAKVFHTRCFQKEEPGKSSDRRVEDSGLTFALA